MLASGSAGLTWEVLFQHHAALALGISVGGAAVTLAATMGGFGLGAAIVARRARRSGIASPLVGYGLAEAVVGLGGLAVAPALELVSALDARLYATMPAAAEVVRLGGLAAVLLVPSTAMGTTIPLLAAQAPRSGARISVLYALNTLGAVLGVLAVTFVLLPAVGVTRTSWSAAGVDLAVAAWATWCGLRARAPSTDPSRERREPSPTLERPARPRVELLAVAMVTGIATFALEVSWFRSVRAAYQATTETFAMILAGFLLPLVLGGALAGRSGWRRVAARPVLLVAAGVAVACVTPVVDQLDVWPPLHVAEGGRDLWLRLPTLVAVFALPVTLLGAVLPALLDEHGTATGTAWLYAANTAGAVVGALGAGFVLLPAFGASATSFGVALLLGVVGAFGARSRLELFGMVAAAAFAAAVGFGLGGSEVGARARVQGFGSDGFVGVLYVAEGPDATVSVTRARRGGDRMLVIDGFEASGESPGAEHYMTWMGYLPSLATPRLARALVICFGTGQTANAVRRMGPSRLDIADVSAAVLRAAPLFRKNQGVLRDPRAHAHVMDGRALLRRTPAATYDVVTLEPMPPNFAGTNALYSGEFYRLVRSRLTPSGAVAQWMPMHLVTESHLRSMLAAFVEVFPHARLWVDPVEGTAIAVAGLRPWRTRPPPVPLERDVAAIDAAYLLDARGVARAAAGAVPVTDDNQLLAYGLDRLARAAAGRRAVVDLYRRNLAYVSRFAQRPAAGLAR